MRVRRETKYQRRRAIVGGVAVLALAGTLTACLTGGADDPDAPAQEAADTAPADTAPEPTVSLGEDLVDATSDDGDQETTDAAEESAPVAGPPPIPSDTSFMERIDYITGTDEDPITPKSVVASGAGLVVANNMMYSHSSTFYDAESREVAATLSDEIVPEDFGVEDHPGTAKGSPVEAAWTDDGKFAYVSQYTMYGDSFGVEGFDDCTPDSGVGPSLLYRFNAELMEWDQVIKVGAVPKYVDITPDQKTILVSNWCDSTISVVDRESAEEIKTIPIAAAPRGIEVLPDNRTAYVAAMYADKLFKVDLETGESEVMMETGRKPRHLNLSPDGKFLFMAVSGADTIYKIDTETEEIVDQVVSGREPRSMIMSSDGTALYVVNYYEPSVAKISTDDMEVLQKEPTDANPIGITYEPITHTVWVACYGGSIYVFDDTLAEDPQA
ncbi:YncE family protein [Ornithinimicrobium faecis]|uniref:YncE family protein n=1 Tax=Ornithinimicrobium faecis TaxID=2934158 RepID=A0ABY4YRA8_9MICO|nr:MULTISPECIES: beta-propeller fold lactonase family protein [unclassified Ornithinimicrobium]USQ78815.1 YncE family protein [Ornithinimicrobium sp. HY1793]